jgi:predicted metal-dependent hydrolase
MMEKRLGPLLDAPVSITITDNTRSMISVNRKNKKYTIRLHHMFLNANAKVLVALAEFISGKSKRNRIQLRRFIGENKGKIRTKNSPKIEKNIKIMHQGKVFNLLDSFERLNSTYFNGNVECRITWGYRRKKKKQKSIRLGSYSSKTSIIRINPTLDRYWIPQYVIDSIIYHEMLHHIIGSKKNNGQNHYHFKAFKMKEKEFLYYEKAKIWIKDNLPRLLDSGNNPL